MAQDYFQDLSSDADMPDDEKVNAIPVTRVQRPEREVDAPLVPRPQRSIRNVTPSSRPRMSRFPSAQGQLGGSGPHHPPRPPKDQDEHPRRRNIILWALLLLALVGVGFAIASVFRKTTIDIVPREYTVVFDEQVTYTAYPETNTTAPEGSLEYTTETKAFEEEVPVTASGSEEVSEAASGTITVYNAYSDSPTRLIKNTRFETPDGKVFRIRDSIIIPGKTATAPGTITATVYADQPGIAYNIPAVDKFVVPGLRDTPEMYNGVYGRSTSPMSGGFVGNRPAVAQSSKQAAETQLKSNLGGKIQEEYEQLESGYALVKLADVSYTPLSVEANADGTLVAKMKASVVMPVIPRTVLDPFLAAQTSATTGEADVRIADPISFKIQPSNTAKVPALGSDNLDFGLSGSAVFVWQVDTAKLMQDLAGKNKSAFEAIVAGYPSIDSAKAKVYPLWSQTFPNSMQIRVERTTSQ